MNKECEETSIDSMIDLVGEATFGMTRTDARKNGVCISCHEPVFNADGTLNAELFHSEAGVKEYYISGMCERCFDKLFSEDEE